MFIKEINNERIILEDNFTFFNKKNELLIEEIKYNKKYLIYNSENYLDREEKTIINQYPINDEYLIFYLSNKQQITFFKTKDAIVNHQAIIDFLELKLLGTCKLDEDNHEIKFNITFEALLSLDDIAVFLGKNDSQVKGLTKLSCELKEKYCYQLETIFKIQDIYDKFLLDNEVNSYFTLVVKQANLTKSFKLTPNFKNKSKVENYFYASKTYPINEENDLFIRLTYKGQFTSVVSEKDHLKAKVNSLKAYEYVIKNNLNEEVYDIYFEKFAQKASESAYILFEYARKIKNKQAYFLLDASHRDYLKLKIKHGKYILKKNSFNAFLKIYQARTFISSERSQHLLPRMSDNDVNLRKKIALNNNKIFLQHGISLATDIFKRKMFDKDNPFNFNYVVTSSLTEKKTILEKSKYQETEIIDTGMPNIDHFVLSRNHIKIKKEITFFLTWREWDVSGRIEEGSYLDRYLSFIKLVETDEFLKDKKVNLILHPKAKHILETQFSHNYLQIKKFICEEAIEKVLKKTAVFISDYSSIIFFSTIAGAYPIFYWQDKNLAEQYYQAPIFINENNVFGDYTYQLSELNYLIKNNYAKTLPYPINSKFTYFVDCLNGDNTKNTYNYLYDKILK